MCLPYRKAEDVNANRVLPDKFYDPVSPERARLALTRYINLQFNKQGERPRASVPADPDDDDLVLSRFIEQYVDEHHERIEAVKIAQHLRWAYEGEE